MLHTTHTTTSMNNNNNSDDDDSSQSSVQFGDARSGDDNVEDVYVFATNNANKQTQPDQLVYMYTHGNLSSSSGNM